MDKEHLNKLLESYAKDADSYESDIIGLENYSEDEIIEISNEYCEDLIEEYRLDVESIVGFFIHGSRVRGNSTEDSDLDIDVYYVGKEREDNMFNILNHDNTDMYESLYIENIKVDFNPKQVSADTDKQEQQIAKFKKQSDEYDKEVLSKLNLNEVRR